MKKAAYYWLINPVFLLATVTCEGVVLRGDPTTPDSDGGSVKMCSPDGLVMIVQAQLPSTGIQLGHDPAFGQAKPITGTLNRGGVVMDDSATDVAGLTVGAPTTRPLVTDDATAIETAITGTGGLGGISGATVSLVLSGQVFKTHEANDAIRSTYQVTFSGGATSTASAVRDTAVQVLTGVSAPGGGTATTPSSSFTINITTVRRNNPPSNDIILVVSPTSLYDDISTLTGIRASDLLNASGVAEAGKGLTHTCQDFTAARNAKVDFVWTVDISGSMGRYQQRLGTAAKMLFSRMLLGNVDMRVGVFEAGNSEPPRGDLSTPSGNGFPSGFQFIQGSDPNGSQAVCRQVTYNGNPNGYCPDDPPTSPPNPAGSADQVNPYAIGYVNPANGTGDGGKESPVAAAVIMFNLFKKNANAGITTPDYVLRSDAIKVAFMVTDEPGATGTPGILNGMNDWWKYFGDARVNPDNNQRWSLTSPSTADFIGGYNSTVLDNVINYFKSNQILTYGMLAGLGGRSCTSNPNPRDLPRCTVEGNGGAAIDIEQVDNQTRVDAAMAQIASDLVGAASQYRLSRTPISSTIRVNVNGVDVPRSRSNGFDYDPLNRSVVFFGSQYNPQLGQQVAISYRAWVGSLL